MTYDPPQTVGFQLKEILSQVLVYINYTSQSEE